MARGTTIQRIDDWIKAHAHPLRGGSQDYDALLGLTRDAHIVLLGASTHGTAEFYTARAAITRRLVKERGFSIVATEADWAAASLVNAYVQGGTGTPLDSLAGFRRFPAWLWRNNLMLDFIEWFRRFNDQIPGGVPRAGFYGLDLFDLPGSITAAIRHLEQARPDLARDFRGHLACLGPAALDSRELAQGIRLKSLECEGEMSKALEDIRLESPDLAREGAGAEELQAEMAALAALHGEEYYRRLLGAEGGLWNLRDRHMAQVLDRLLAWHGPGAKAVVWAHNSHVGDMRATAGGPEGMVNLCQILREKYGEQVVAVGFGAYDGTVTAAPYWDAAPEFTRLPPISPFNIEETFHRSGVGRFYLCLRALTPDPVSRRFLFTPKPERVVGVVMDPASLAARGAVRGELANRYDAYFFYDKTLAVEPLDASPVPAGLDTYPSGE